MTRVLTDKGFGEISPIEFNRTLYAQVKVELEKNDALGWRQTFLRRDVYEFGDHMIVRVVNVKRMGVCSNILPFGQMISAYRAYHANMHGGETRFLLNLVTGQFEISNQLGLLANRFLHIQTWMNRWMPEPSTTPSSDDNSPDSAISKFDEWEKGCAGTSGGIFAPVLLDFEEMKILRFAIAVTVNRGIVFSKHF